MMTTTIPLAQQPTPTAPLRAPAGSIAAGVGTTSPAIAALRIATALHLAIATATSASAWREPLNPVHFYPFTLYGGRGMGCLGEGPSRGAPKGAPSGWHGGCWGSGAKPLVKIFQR